MQFIEITAVAILVSFCITSMGMLIALCFASSAAHDPDPQSSGYYIFSIDDAASASITDITS